MLHDLIIEAKCKGWIKNRYSQKRTYFLNDEISELKTAGNF